MGAMILTAVPPGGKVGKNCVDNMDNDRLAAERLEKELQQQKAALKEQKDLEKRQKKARRNLIRTQRRSARARARMAAKEVAPDRFVIVLNGRPVEVREARGGTTGRPYDVPAIPSPGCRRDCDTCVSCNGPPRRPVPTWNGRC